MQLHLYTDIYDYLCKYVKGQEDAKKHLALLGYLYSMRCMAIEGGVLKSSLPLLNTMLIGPTGVGKSLLACTLAQYFKLPFIRIDCASLCQVGWDGATLKDWMKIFSNKLWDENAEAGIIFLDEIDKLGSVKTSTTGRVPSMEIQSNLLDLLEGRYDCPGRSKHINNCLIICAGAFTQSTEFAKKRKFNIGFKTINEHKQFDWKQVMYEGGLVKELVGRITNAVEVKELTRKEIREVILESESSIFKQYKNLLPEISLEIKELDELVEQVYNSAYGLRELDAAVFKLIKQKILKHKLNVVK